jgi:hypothetical protein
MILYYWRATPVCTIAYDTPRQLIIKPWFRLALVVLLDLGKCLVWLDGHAVSHVTLAMRDQQWVPPQ